MPSLRTCAGTAGPTRPVDPGLYTQLHLAGDVVGLLDALGEGPAVVVGHDWGAPLAWNTSLFRPDLVRGVVGLSVPYVPRGDTDVLTTLSQLLGESNYQAYFQELGVAEAALEADPERFLRRIVYALSGDNPDPTDLSFPPGFRLRGRSGPSPPGRRRGSTPTTSPSTSASSSAPASAAR